MSLPDLSYLTPAQQEAFLNSPALPAPPNVTPNPLNPPNANTLSYTIISLAIALSTTFVLIRFYVSWVISKTIFVSDVMLILSYGLSIGYYGVVLDSIVHVGYLVHQWDVDYRDFFYVLKSFYITPTLYGLSIMFIKFAIVLEWNRIFNPQHVKNAFYWASCVILAVNALFYVSAAFILNFACRPWARFYNPFIKGSCFDPTQLYLAAGVINFVVDVAIFILPQKVIWDLQISKKRRLGVTAIFAVGIFAIIAAGFRLAWTVEFETSSDVLYRQSSLGLWVAAEMTSAILVFCVPSVPRFTKNNGLSGMFSTLAKWKKSSRTADSTDPSRPSAGRWPADERSYQRIQGPDSIPLDTLKSSTTLRPTYSPGPQRGLSRQHDLEILRTTHIVTSSEHSSGQDVEGPIIRQHPWEGYE
ncbi:hypothetical protein F5Y10DRAFT_243138 [Nemania abortiva]|nr:hypothetical protein F5Y10DRAFT_243138 [Nemania abortiva]